MKNISKLLEIIALVVLIMLPFASCGKSSGIQALTLTSIDDLNKWLDIQSLNTKETSYSIKLNVSDISDISFVLDTLPIKYISLDLSGSAITTIHDRTFYNCSSLTNVTIPNGVTSIGRTAFAICTSLVNVKIPNSVTSIGNNSFSGCTSLTKVNIPDSVTSIGNFSFSRCTSLANVSIPNSVISIGQGAFDGCTSLTSVKFEGKTEIMTTRASGVEYDFYPSFPGDLGTKYLAGGPGTYSRPSGDSEIWIKRN
jgi:hypothetical protein